VSHVNLAQWERAEIARSALEAQHTPDDELAESERDFSRYVNPPADTAYPLEYLYRVVGHVAGLTVIDLGCGSGMHTLYLRRRGAFVFAVDISPELIAVARRRLEMHGVTSGVQFLVSSAHTLPFGDASADVVFGNAILHHLDLATAAREIHRVLKPGGRAVFQEPVQNSRAYRAVRRLIPFRHPDVSPYERPLTEGELSGMARDYRQSSARAFSLPHVRLGHLLPFVRNHLAPLYRLDAALIRRVPALSSLAAIRVVELTK
jgi:SAM-dependent methyltransferase